MKGMTVFTVEFVERDGDGYERTELEAVYRTREAAEKHAADRIANDEPSREWKEQEVVPVNIPDDRKTRMQDRHGRWFRITEHEVVE